MDRERQWYRYHQLFADVLQARLLPEQEAPLAVLQERAAAWYEAEGMVGEAIEHALAGRQFERAARLLEQPGAAEPVTARLEALLETGEKPGREAGRGDRVPAQRVDAVRGRAPGCSGQTLGARVLLAKLHWRAGRREQAITVLEPALAQGSPGAPPTSWVPGPRRGSTGPSGGTEPEELTRCFVAAGPELIPALRQAAAQGIAPEMVGTLLTKLGTGAQRSARGAGTRGGAPPAGARPGAASAGTSLPLAEPLSERELEVLRLVAAGLRNAEIAAQLFLRACEESPAEARGRASAARPRSGSGLDPSPIVPAPATKAPARAAGRSPAGLSSHALSEGTVHRHIHNLYGKLGVSSRTNAVARARALGLL